MNRRTLLIAAAVLILIAIPVAWWLASPLFIDRTVDEALPLDVPPESAIAGMSPAAAEDTVNALMADIDEAFVEQLPDEQAEDLEDRMMQLAARMPDHEMNDSMLDAAAAWVVAGQGRFRDADAAHRGSGAATIFQQGERRVLRFTDFEATNGPDLHVLLVENVDGTSHDSLGEYFDLGSLKGNIGNQNYELPSNVDLSLYGGVVIYCKPFHVVFASAPLDG